MGVRGGRRGAEVEGQGGDEREEGAEGGGGGEGVEEGGGDDERVGLERGGREKRGERTTEAREEGQLVVRGEEGEDQRQQVLRKAVEHRALRSVGDAVHGRGGAGSSG